MKLTRWELTLDGHNRAGLLTAGWAFNLLSNVDLEEINNVVPKPRIDANKWQDDALYYFTEVGSSRFGYLHELVLQNAAKKNINIQILKEELYLDDVMARVVYQDEWQVVVVNVIDDVQVIS